MDTPVFIGFRIEFASFSKNQFRILLCIIVIVNLVLLLVWLFTSHYEADFVSHFNFASTVTSIILSVLAIFLSISGESKTQEIRDKIVQQADEIVKATDTLEYQMKDLSVKMDTVVRNTDDIKGQAQISTDSPKMGFSLNWGTVTSSEDPSQG